MEESARANPDARIRPLTHASVDRAYQAKSVGGNSLVTILIAIRRSPNLLMKISGEIASFEKTFSNNLVPEQNFGTLPSGKCQPTGHDPTTDPQTTLNQRVR